MNQKKYKTILFDIDDTLIDFDIDQKTAFKEAVKKIGYVCTDKMYEDYNKINLSMWEELNLGKMTLNEVFVNRFSVFFKKYGIKYDELEFNKILTDMFQKTGTLIKGVKETLDKLVNNYELAVISNGPKDQQYHRLKNANISKYFSEFFISEEIGYNKPDKRFFDIVFKNIDNKEKSKILIVGDSITSDIIGGKQVGVDTCLYNIRNKENKTNIKPEYEIENFEELLQIL
ncbi:MAG: noncanonical pyrimidine nucleotidase, YjjG family [Clostridia bacterium]|nr:noncanonical pyrimidine nucleotidase, YjjG family [Clostridia bacterium]